MFVFGGNVKKTAELRSPILRTESLLFLFFIECILYYNYALFAASIPSIPQGFALSTDVVFAKVHSSCST